MNHRMMSLAAIGAVVALSAPAFAQTDGQASVAGDGTAMLVASGLTTENLGGAFGTTGGVNGSLTGNVAGVGAGAGAMVGGAAGVSAGQVSTGTTGNVSTDADINGCVSVNAAFGMPSSNAPSDCTP